MYPYIKRVSLALLLLVIIKPISSYSQSPCSHEKFRAFDFWIGEWKVLDQDGNYVGQNKIEVILDSCVILENWKGAGKSVGKSFNHYDFTTKQWKQKWVDNFGSNLEFTGQVKNDTAIYYCKSLNPRSNSTIYNKMMIAKVSDSEVHQVWEQSEDSINWSVVFDGQYLKYDKLDEPSIVYKNFSKAYATLDYNLLAEQYDTMAIYLKPSGSIVQGRDLIKENFKQFFERVDDREQKMKIEFKLISQERSADLCCDIGYYKLTYIENGEEMEHHAGKFSTVLKRSKKGVWMFISDTYSELSIEDFDNGIDIWSDIK
jgi:ketosteroid isomerase-like protein